MEEHARRSCLSFKKQANMRCGNGNDSRKQTCNALETQVLVNLGQVSRVRSRHDTKRQRHHLHILGTRGCGNVLFECNGMSVSVFVWVKGRPISDCQLKTHSRLDSDIVQDGLLKPRDQKVGTLSRGLRGHLYCKDSGMHHSSVLRVRPTRQAKHHDPPGP